MNKFFAFILILIIAPILGAIYGVIHDQITYTISPEYYTKFKFIQFGLEDWGNNVGTGKTPEIIINTPRIAVAFVGILATWWMGLFIGIILGLVGFIHANGSSMLKATIKSFIITILITLLTGVIGLGYGKLFLVNNPPNWFLPDNLIDRASFILVGSMHNFSYLGGLLGLIAGVYFSINRKKAINKFSYDIQ